MAIVMAGIRQTLARLSLRTKLIGVGIFASVIVALTIGAILNARHRQSVMVESGDSSLFDRARESGQVARHLEAVALRQMRIEQGLPLDDPNCDPNNFPLPPGWHKVESGTAQRAVEPE